MGEEHPEVVSQQQGCPSGTAGLMPKLKCMWTQLEALGGAAWTGRRGWMELPVEVAGAPLVEEEA